MKQSSNSVVPYTLEKSLASHVPTNEDLVQGITNDAFDAKQEQSEFKSDESSKQSQIPDQQETMNTSTQF